MKKDDDDDYDYDPAMGAGSIAQIVPYTNRCSAF